MPGFKGLFVPGPTNMPFQVRAAMDVPLEDHRAPDYPQFIKPLLADVKKIFQTETGHVIIFPGSGTGGWESAISNTLSPGDKVLASVFGQFSLLWVDLCQRFGLDVDAIDTEWGKGVPLDQYRAKLAADKQHEIKAVLVTHNETATGVTSDVAGVRRILDELKHPAMLFVDGVSSIGSIDFRMDEWGVDVAVAGSQKGFMMPTGLAIVVRQPESHQGRRDRQAAALLPRLQGHAQEQRAPATSPIRRRPPCCGRCAPRSTCCWKKAWKTCSRAIAGSPARSAPRSRPGACAIARKVRNGTPTR